MLAHAQKRKTFRLDETVHLTPREPDLICQELTAPEIVEKLFLSKRTIEGHRNTLLEKTGVRNTVGLIIYCLRNQVIQLEEI